MQVPLLPRIPKVRTRRGSHTPKLNLIAACQSSASILFSGAPDAAEAAAREIHRMSGWRSGPFVVIDCEMELEDIDALLAWLFVEELRDEPDASPRPSQYGVVFLRDIHHLPAAAQAKLAEYLWRQRSSSSAGPRRRVIASSSVRLIPRVLGGSFNDELYYRLTPIHIVIG
jgi:DNA-binding NtrC family response regulator